MKTHKIMIFLLGLLLISQLSGCLQNQEAKNTSVGVEERIPVPGLKPELEQFDIEEVAQEYNQSDLNVSVHSFTSSPALDKPDRQHHDHARKEQIRKLLKGLLDGPCPINSDQVFDKLLSIIEQRIIQLNDLLKKTNELSRINKIKERIQILEELEIKIIEKKEECALGSAECTDEFKAKFTKLIARLDQLIEGLERKIQSEQDLQKKEHLEKLLERTIEQKNRFQDILNRC